MMKRFIKVQQQNTLPIFMYLISSVLCLFIHDTILVLMVYGLFILTSYLFTRSFKSIFIAFLTVFFVGIVVLIIRILRNQSNLIDFSFISLSLSIAMFIGSSIIIFLRLPTYQHVRLISFFPSQNAPFALLSALRVFEIIRISSTQIVLAQKARGINRSKKVLFSSYLSNMFVIFLEYLYYHLCNITLIEKIRIKNRIIISNLLLLETLKLTLCLISFII